MPNKFSRTSALVLFCAILVVIPELGYAQANPGAAGSVQVTIPASVSQDGFTGSVPSGNATAELLQISFLDAIDRGLKQNLGLLLSGDNTLAARGAKWKELSNLLPNVEAKSQENVQQTSLAALGFRLPGFPRVIGPFNYLDTRAFLTQEIFNWNYIQKERAAAESTRHDKLPHSAGSASFGGRAHSQPHDLRREGQDHAQRSSGPQPSLAD